MSTEITQTEASPSGTSAESTSANTTPDITPALGEPTTTMDSLKKVAKDSADGTGNFSPKSVEQQVAETQRAAFTPNYKYRAASQEKEIGEFWRPLIKDADSERQVKEALSKLDGFDFVKNSREKIQQDFNSLTQDYQAQTQVVQRVEGALQKGDISSVFRQLGIRDEDVFKWTQQKLQMMELPPEQRKAFEDAENMRLQQSQMEEKMSGWQQMYEEQAVQARTMQLDFLLSRPEVAQSAHNWDSSVGEMGNFRNLVIQEAQHAFYTRGQDLTAEQAVGIVLNKFRGILNQGQAGQATAPQAQAYAPTMTQPAGMQQQKPVIPNVQGKGASPIKKAPRSLDDLKRLAKESAAEG